MSLLAGIRTLGERIWTVLWRKFPFRVQCNACGWRGRILASDSWHPHTKCPRCRSRVRHRLLCAALAHLEPLRAAKLVRGKRVLHFAPEPQISRRLRAGAARYVTADPAMPGVDLRLDMCRMAEVPDGTFDLVVACDVLYYLPVDRLRHCVARIERSLTAGGAFVPVHYVPRMGSVLSGDEAHDVIASCATLRHELAERTEFGAGRTYRVDRYVKD